jgi:hypothetical protein
VFLFCRSEFLGNKFWFCNFKIKVEIMVKKKVKAKAEIKKKSKGNIEPLFAVSLFIFVFFIESV